MLKKISWRKLVPLFAVSILSVAAVSATVSAHSNTDQRSNWQSKGDTKYYLKIAGIEGDTTAKGFEGTIELDSYRIMEDEPDMALTADNQASTSLSNLGDNNLRFIAESSKASPWLFKKAASGERISDATLTVKKGNRSSGYLTLKMSDIAVSNYQNSGNDDNDSVDEVVFDYGTITVEHNEGSPTKKGWDFRSKKEL